MNRVATRGSMSYVMILPRQPHTLEPTNGRNDRPRYPLLAQEPQCLAKVRLRQALASCIPPGMFSGRMLPVPGSNIPRVQH